MSTEQYTKEQIIEEARGRGYTVHALNSSHTWYSLHNDSFHINLQLRFKENEITFELSHMLGLLTLSTGECGSFMNGVHFFRIQHQMIEAIWKLQGRY